MASASGSVRPAPPRLVIEYHRWMGKSGMAEARRGPRGVGWWKVCARPAPGAAAVRINTFSRTSRQYRRVSLDGPATHRAFACQMWVAERASSELDGEAAAAFAVAE